MRFNLVRNPSPDLQAAVAKRQGVSIASVKRHLSQKSGDRIYWWVGKRGPEIAIQGFI